MDGIASRIETQMKTSKKTLTSEQKIEAKRIRVQQAKRASAMLRKQSHRKKERARIQRIESGVATTAFSIHRTLHVAMKELARRKHKQTNWFIDGFYKQALREFLTTIDVPKRMIKLDRARVKLQMDAETISMLDDCARIAYKQERPVASILEQAIDAYLSKPENYLGEAFNAAHPDKYESID
jgi:hypothetical protein